MIVYKSKRFLLLVAMGTLLIAAQDTDEKQKFENGKDHLRQEIESAKKELYLVRPHIEKQVQDSIATFDKTSPDAISLREKQQQKQDLQIKITKITEQCWKEYWLKNFPKYTAYIDSLFSEKDIQELSDYVDLAHFTLSCDIDTNYYNSLDEILYGPYWREFAFFISSESPKLAKKYTNVRKSAEQQYPFIFPKTVFYDGPQITTTDSTKANATFTEAIKLGRELLRQKSVAPNKYMYKYNKYRNVSKIFTADIHFLVESIFVGYQEYMDLQSPLFALHIDELQTLTNDVISLNSQIIRLNIRHDKEIKNIKNHFDTIVRQQESDKSAHIKSLQNALEMFSAQKTK